MNILILLLIIFSGLFSQIPYQINFSDTSENRFSGDNFDNGLTSNSIIDMIVHSDKMIVMGTSGGLNIGIYDDFGNYTVQHPDDSVDMPEGGNPAIAVRGDVIAVSGVYTNSTFDMSAGSGISYSIDGGDTWKHIEQPLDSMPEQYSCKWWRFHNLPVFYDTEQECENACLDCAETQSPCSRIYQYISWGGQDEIVHLAVTTDVNNISYGLEIHGDYIYATSWAGGLRRYNYILDSGEWEIVPLPLDDQTHLYCGAITQNNYVNDPVGDSVCNDLDGDGCEESESCGSDNDNQKPFSVYAVEDTLWVGTADGINKGIVDGDCIDWEHLTAEENGLYDNWVLSFSHEELSDGSIRMWAVTWDRRYEKSHYTYGGPPCYSDNGGDSWNIVTQLDQMDLLTYNVSVHPSINEIQGAGILISSNEGLFISDQTGNVWEKISLPSYVSDAHVFDAEVMDSMEDTWIGTSSGLLVEYAGYYDYLTASGNTGIKFYSYPNPASSVVTFTYEDSESNMDGEVTIFDFSMDRVIKLNAEGVTRWYGNNENGDQVADGVYFARYIHSDGSAHWFKILCMGI